MRSNHSTSFIARLTAVMLCVSCAFTAYSQEFMGGDIKAERLNQVDCAFQIDLHYQADSSYAGHSIPFEIQGYFHDRLDWEERTALSKGLVRFRYRTVAHLPASSSSMDFLASVDTMFVVDDLVNWEGGSAEIRVVRSLRDGPVGLFPFVNFDSPQDGYFFDVDGALVYPLSASNAAGGEVEYGFNWHLNDIAHTGGPYSLPAASDTLSLDRGTGLMVWDKPVAAGRYLIGFDASLITSGFIHRTNRLQVLEITEEDIIVASNAELQDKVLIRLYPNPTTSTLYLKAKLPSPAPALLTVQDAMGRELLRQPLPAGRGQHELDVSAWPAGVYFLRLRQGEVEVVERFVKGE